VTTAGAEDPARVRRWSLRPGGQNTPGPVRRAATPVPGDADPLAPKPDRDSLRQQDVFLLIR